MDPNLVEVMADETPPAACLTTDRSTAQQPPTTSTSFGRPDQATTKNDRQRLMVAGMAAGVTVFGTLALTAPFVFLRSPLPYMATPRGKVRRALQYLQQQQQQPAVATNCFVDLGSGDGQAVLEALRIGYRRALGIELNFTLYAISQFRRWLFWTADERARSAFLCRDLFGYQNLTAADTIMIFGVNPLMKPLSEKLARECRSGTHILSYRFVLPTAKPESADNTNLVRASLIYSQEEMHIYRVVDR